MPLLRQEDAKRQARRWRSRAISAAALVIVLIGLLALVIALYSRSEERRLLATSRALAVQAMDRSDKDLDLSLLLSAESHTAADTLESRKALLQNLLANPHLNRFLHGDSAVASLAFHPGQPMLAALSNRSIFIWDILSNQRPLDLAEGETKYRALRFFDSGKTLAATTSDGTLVLWDFETRKRIASIAPAKPNYSCASPVATNRPVLATETPSSILIWDLTSKSVCSTIDLEKDDAILNVAPSPSGEVVAVNTRNYGVRLWDVEKHLYRSTKFHGHSGFIDAVTFSPDGKVIATGSFDESVILWDVETGSRKEWWTKQKAPVSMLEFSPDDRFIAWGTRSGKVQIFDKIENRFLKMPGLGFRFLDALVFSLDSRTLAIAGGGQIAVLDLLKENRISTVHPTRQRIIGIVFSPSDNLAASAGADGEVILWDTNHKTVLGQSTAPLPLGGCMGFSPDGQKLITCNKAGTAFLWEIANGSARFLGTISSESGKITAVAFHSGGKGVVSGDESGLVSSWEAASPLGSKPRPLTSVGCRIANVAFSLGGDLIAFGCTEGEVHLINFLGQHLAKFKNDSHPITGVAFSPDGQQLFTSGQEGIVTWNLKSGTKVGTPLELRQLGADSLALSPRGNVIASASRTGWIGLWDTETKSLLGDFQSHGDAFYSVALAPSGRLLAAGSGYLAGADDALMFLDLDPKNWVQHACAIAARNMTPEEWRRYMSEGSPSDTCASHHAHE
jgi:WD40 repeat protein